MTMRPSCGVLHCHHREELSLRAARNSHVRLQVARKARSYDEACLDRHQQSTCRGRETMASSPPTAFWYAASSPLRNSSTYFVQPPSDRKSTRLNSSH